MPELTDAKIKRFMDDYGFSIQEAGILSSEKGFADYFEKVVSISTSPVKTIFNWMVGEFTRHINEHNFDMDDIPVSPANFAQLLELFTTKVINDFTTKEILQEMFISNKNALEIVSEKNLLQISDEESLGKIVSRIIEENPDPVKQYQKGKETLFQWFMGQVSRETKGKSNPEVVRQILIKLLNKQQ